MRYLDQLGRELSAVGIRGRLRCCARCRRCHERGPRNAVAEVVVVAAGFLALGKRLGLGR